MNKEKISDKQGIALVALFIMGSSLVIGTGSIAGKDTWLAIILAILFSFPMLMVYARVLFVFPEKDLFDILEIVFGEFFGKIISILYIWYAFHLGVMVLRNFGEFINTVALEETPMIIPIIVLAFLCIWGIKNGMEVLGRVGEVALIILIPLIFLTIGLLMPEVELNNIRPILSNGMNPVLKGAFSVFSFPFAETILFSFVFSGLKKKNSPYKVYTLGLLIGGMIIFATAINELLVLGVNEYTTTYFPAHSSVSRIDVGTFLQRLEIIVAISFLGSGFVKICICLLGACNGIAKVFNFHDYRFIVVPIGLLMINLSYFIYDSTMEMGEWAFTTYDYYAFFYQVILPVFIIIFAEFKKKRLENTGGIDIE